MKYTFIDKKNSENFEYHFPINYTSFPQKSIFEELYQLDTEAREDLGTFFYYNHKICQRTEYIYPKIPLFTA